MSAILQTIIGAAAAIVGGFVGAWWQTRRADDVARRIRREERKEQALLALFSKASDVLEHLTSIARMATTTPLTSQYDAARQPLGELRQLWDTDLVAVIPDHDIRGAMWEVYYRSRELLPRGAEAAEAIARYAEDSPAAKAAHFSKDLAELTSMMQKLKSRVLEATRLSDAPGT
jgi:hypothetical protein